MTSTTTTAPSRVWFAGGAHGSGTRRACRKALPAGSHPAGRACCPRPGCFMSCATRRSSVCPGTMSCTSERHRSLAHDGTYRETALPGDPWQTKYPPGYPLMLAAILKWNPAALNFWIIAHSWVWMAAASFALAWAMRQTGLTPVQAAIVGALWAANPAGANAAIFAMADTPYCAVLFLVLGLVLRLDKAAIWNAALAGLLMGIACLIRSAGIVAIGGLVAWLLWRRSLKTAVLVRRFRQHPSGNLDALVSRAFAAGSWSGGRILFQLRRALASDRAPDGIEIRSCERTSYSV